MLSSLWAKLAAAGAVLLGILGALFMIRRGGVKQGRAEQREEQRKVADKAKAKMDAAKEVKGEKDTLSDLDSGKF